MNSALPRQERMIKTKRFQRQLWLLLIPVILALALLGLWLVVHLAGVIRLEDQYAETLHSQRQADYSADPRDVLFAPLNPGIVMDTYRDRLPRSTIPQPCGRRPQQPSQRIRPFRRTRPPPLPRPRPPPHHHRRTRPFPRPHHYRPVRPRNHRPTHPYPGQPPLRCPHPPQRPHHRPPPHWHRLLTHPCRHPPTHLPRPLTRPYRCPAIHPCRRPATRLDRPPTRPSHQHLRCSLHQRPCLRPTPNVTVEPVGGKSRCVKPRSPPNWPDSSSAW